MRILYRENMIDEFIFEVNVTAGQTITLPLVNGYTHDFTAIWGDGSANGRVTAYNDSDAVHTYTSAGTYIIRIRGKCQSFALNGASAMRTNITRVIRWGTAADFLLLNFYGCTNLTQLPFDGTGITAITGASNITTMAHFLRGCTSFTQALNDRMFSNLTLCTSFESTFDTSGISGIVPVDLFRYNTLATTFKRTFFTTSISGECDTYYTDLFKYNTVAQIFEETFAVTSISGNVSNVMFTYSGANATNFRGTFRNTNLGSLGEVLPADIFDTNVNAINFGFTFNFTKYTCAIPLLFTYNTLAQDFNSTFASTPFSGIIPADLFRNAGSSALIFSSTFSGTSISGVPNTLFYYNVNATHFNYTFSSCKSLTNNSTLGYNVYNNVLFSQNTKAITFQGTFWLNNYTTGTLCEDMFWNNPLVTNFSFCFGYNHGITGSIPPLLFRYNPLVTDFGYIFYIAGSVSWNLSGEIPADLFAYCPLVTSFTYAFRWQYGLTKAPNGLFRNNKLATNFIRTFETMGNLAVEEFVFCTGAADRYARFSGVTPSFDRTFVGGGGARYAPELWNPSIYDMGTLQLNLNVAPATSWVAGDTITGQSSGTTCIVVSKVNNTAYRVKEVSGIFTDGEVVGVTGDAAKLADQGTGYPTITAGGGNTVITVNVSPSTDWAANDIITGQTSGATCIVISKLTATTYYVRNVVGAFTDGEVIGVTGNVNKLADQNAGAPTFTRVVTSTYCFNPGGTNYSNYAAIPAAWK